MNDEQALREQLQAMLDKAVRTLSAARKHLADRDSDFASSKAYYAVFHLMQAVLLTRGLTYSKHAGVISGFSEQFIKTGIFPSEFSQMIQRLRKDRELGDYGYQLSVSFKDAADDVEASAQIVECLSNFLKTFLP